jgi:hypothetical protein
MRKPVLLMVLFACLLFIASEVSAQLSMVIDGQEGCEAVGGSWSSGTCTIATLEIASGDTLTIAESIGVVVTGYLTNTGTIANNGTVEVADAATFTNNGSVENYSGGTIQNSPGSTGSAIANGVAGHLVNHEGANLLNGSGCAMCLLHNSGVIDNAGRFESEDMAAGEILNEGTINNGGLLRIGSGYNWLTNASGGVINNELGGSIEIFASGTLNSGLIDNGATFIIGDGIDFENGGTITIYNGATFTVGYGVELTNDGTIYIECGGIFENNGTLLGNPVEFEVCYQFVYLPLVIR